MTILARLLNTCRYAFDDVRGAAYSLDAEADVLLRDLDAGWEPRTFADDAQLADALAHQPTSRTMTLVAAPFQARRRVDSLDQRPLGVADESLARIVRAVFARALDDEIVCLFVPGRYLGSVKMRPLRECAEVATYPIAVVEGALHSFVGEIPRDLVAAADSAGALVLYGGGRFAAPPTRFFLLPDGADEDSVVDDFRRLLNQPAGQTRHGWIYQDPLDGAESLRATRFSVDVVRLRERLATIGEVRTLAQIVEFVPPIAPEGINGTAWLERRVPILQAREIDVGGRVRPLIDRLFAAPTEHELLREGDVCIRASVGPSDSQLAVAVIPSDVLPLASDRSILTIRFNPSVEPAVVPFLIEYLRSPRALRLLGHDAERVALDRDRLGGLEVPIPHRQLKAALYDLWAAERHVERFEDEIRSARRAFFHSTAGGSPESLPDLLRARRLVNQRTAAALEMDRVASRLRHGLPHPLASAWRAIETGGDDLETYRRVLELAETATAYLAVVGLASAGAVAAPHEAFSRIAAQCRRGQHGLGFGDWSEIVMEYQGKDFRQSTSLEGFPVPEIMGCLDASTPATGALNSLRKRRNDFAHGRGPSTGSELIQAVD